MLHSYYYWLLKSLRARVSMDRITIGYHRLYSHRAFRAAFGVRVALATLGASAFQGSIKVRSYELENDLLTHPLTLNLLVVVSLIPCTNRIPFNDPCLGA